MPLMGEVCSCAALPEESHSKLCGQQPINVVTQNCTTWLIASCPNQQCCGPRQCQKSSRQLLHSPAANHLQYLYERQPQNACSLCKLTDELMSAFGGPPSAFKPYLQTPIPSKMTGSRPCQSHPRSAGQPLSCPCTTPDAALRPRHSAVTSA
jgi:hypothetical protein